MKGIYKVHWTDVAESDLVEIVEYISEDSPTAARRVFESTTERAERLCHTPEECRIVPELLDQGITTYREMIVVPWRIIYRIEKENVFVLSVIDGRRNIEDVLLYMLATRKCSPYRIT